MQPCTNDTDGDLDCPGTIDLLDRSGIIPRACLVFLGILAVFENAIELTKRQATFIMKLLVLDYQAKQRICYTVLATVWV